MNYRVQLVFISLLLSSLVVSVCSAVGQEAADKAAVTPPEPPPALVAVALVASGEAEPMNELVGTVYYSKKARVAAEIEGLAALVGFEEGDRVKAGQQLVKLNTDILETTITGTRAAMAQVEVELEQAGKDMARISGLYKEGSVSESAYEDYYYKEKVLEKRVAALQASLDRLNLELRKKTIAAPFGGVVTEKRVEVGEWVSAGGTIAGLADDSEIDVVVDVPAAMLAFLEPGRPVQVKSGGRVLEGRFASYVPSGDIATRTFVVKLRLKNTAGLVEGMEARAVLPVGEKNNGLLVPHDAVLDKYGTNVVFVVQEGKARMIPVQVVGYNGMQAGVAGPGLESGQQVVVKGNERLRDGQAVRPAE